METGYKSMHNAYHHESLGFAREVKDKAMVTFFIKRLREIEDYMEMNRVSP